MILTGSEIKKEQKKGNIVIEGFRDYKLNPNSYNLTLGNEILTYKNPKLRMDEPNDYIVEKIPSTGLLIRPGKVYLCKTAEYTETHGFVPMLEGRSSVGRLGLFIHVTAGFGDVGYKGNWTLELSCIQPIILIPGTEICQIYYHTIQGDTEIKYNGKYQGSKGVLPSGLWKEFIKQSCIE